MRLRLFTVIGLMLTFSAFAGSGWERAQALQALLSDKGTFLEAEMQQTGRIGELNISARIIELNPTSSMLDAFNAEVAYMVRMEELFRHQRPITDLASLLSDGTYQVIIKTGESKERLSYSSDGILKDIQSFIHPSAKECFLQLVKNKRRSTDLGYLRTWTTVSEYDGMEKFFFRVDESHMVILTIDNCGGC
jgi:hypothetical protein